MTSTHLADGGLGDADLLHDFGLNQEPARVDVVWRWALALVSAL